jgi:hypothetical protein
MSGAAPELDFHRNRYRSSAHRHYCGDAKGTIMKKQTIYPKEK